MSSNLTTHYTSYSKTDDDDQREARTMRYRAAITLENCRNYLNFQKWINTTRSFYFSLSLFSSQIKSC